jgi:hypothetical protein
MYVLQIVGQVVAERSVERAALALDMLDAELEEFTKAHGVAIQIGADRLTRARKGVLSSTGQSEFKRSFLRVM